MDELGIHARPAGQLAKEAKSLGETTVYVIKGGKTVKASQLMKLMGLGVKKGDTVTVRVEGGDETYALSRMEAFFRNNFAAEF